MSEAPREGRNAYLRFRLTSAEKREVEKRAQHLEVSVTRYLIDTALSRRLPRPYRRDTYAELQRIRRELAAAGSNLNQIARGVNLSVKAGQPVAVDAERLSGALEAVEKARESLGYALLSLD